MVLFYERTQTFVFPKALIKRAPPSVPPATREPAFHNRFGAAHIRCAQPRGKAPELIVPLRRKPKGEFELPFQPRVTQPERNGVLQEFEEKCLRRQPSFFPSCKTKCNGGNPPPAGKEFGVSFFASVSLDKQRNEVGVRGRTPPTSSLTLQPTKNKKRRPNRTALFTSINVQISQEFP
jgi:hypothetical protein